MKVTISSLTGAKLNWAVALFETLSPCEFEGSVVIGKGEDEFGGIFYDYEFEPRGTEDHLREKLLVKYSAGWIEVEKDPFLKLKGNHVEYISQDVLGTINITPPSSGPSSVSFPPPLMPLPTLRPMPLEEASPPFLPEEILLEKEIQDKGLNAPRLTPEQIDAVILGKTFTVLPSGKTMVCELILKNGFSVRGEASVVSRENFNQEIGEKISFKNARDKVWELEGYLLQQQTWENSL